MKRTSILLCLLFAVTANSFTAAKAHVNTSDSLALVDLYNSTDGPNWNYHTNWLTTAPVSTWAGVTVTNNRVTKLSLGGNMLKGVLPSSIGHLTNLRFLILYENQLTGTIPNTISNLDSLTYLNFYSNEFSGNIPTSITKLIHLTYLDLSYNHFSGAVPPSLGKLVNLTILVLYHNYLSGTIPVELGMLSKIEELYLNYNQLTGAIPASLDKLKNCSISLNNNHLSQFARFNASKDTNYLISLDIADNYFTFNQLQAVAKYINYSGYYAPQDTILPIHQNGNTLSVSAGGTLGNNTYFWHKAGDTSKTIIKKDSTFSPAQSGKYYVRVFNKLVKGLTLYSDTISYTMPLAQTQNTIANVAELKTTTNHFSIYPNPAKDIIHIGVNGNSTIVLTNSAGKILFLKNINTDSEINVSSYANGVYYIQNKTTGETKKIVVVH